MTTITLPPDLDFRLGEEAQRRGTTPELLALDGLRQLFGPAHADHDAKEKTLFDSLAGYIGTVNGPAEPFSENCGRRFANGLAEKNERTGKLP